MTIDEAIRHCEEVADEKEEDVILYHNCATYNQNQYEKGLAENTEKECRACAEEHRQLAEWLKELKAYREKLNCTDCIIDGTDACSRGAGRAVDDEICGDFMSSRSEIPNTFGDAISREAAVNAIYDLCGENVSLKENPFRDNPHMDAVIDELENLPSVSPQQKVGRWIETQEPNDVEPFKLWECSRCEQRQRRKSNYCPDCGAKMVEPQESEEQMTREEAIKGLTSLVEVRRKYCDMQTMKDEIECLEMAIEALGQEPILDKIRAEIDEQYDRVHPYDISCAEGLEMALGIIDKYKEESEVEE